MFYLSPSLWIQYILLLLTFLQLNVLVNSYQTGIDGFRSQSFLPIQTNIIKGQAYSHRLEASKVEIVIPTTPRARASITIRGPAVDNALFRAELKKELTFFRGCHANYRFLSQRDSAQIETEGKTNQLEKFLVWLRSLETELSQRKPTFQGPQLVISIENIKWTDFVGDLKGFNASEEAPALPEGAKNEKTTEAKNMMGTDESV